MKGKKKKVATRDEDGDANDDKVPENAREVVEKLKEISNRSEQEIYAMLVECDMDANETITRLLSQDEFQLVKSRREKKKEIKDTSDSKSQIVGSNIQDRKYCNVNDHNVGLGDENKPNSDETSNVEGIHNHSTVSSTSCSILGPIPNTPLNSDRTNVETKRVPLLSVPSSRSQPSRGCGTSRQRTMDLPFINVLKMGLGSPKESVNQAPVKDESPFDEKPDAPYPFSNSFIESATSDQLQESASVSSENLLNDPSQLQMNTSELSHLKFGQFGCDQREDKSDFEDDLSLKNMNLRDDEFQKEEEQRLRRNVSSSGRYETHEPSQENQSAATDFTFDNSQRLNPVEASSEPSLVMQNVDRFLDTMHQQAYSRAPGPRYSAFPFNQSVTTTASSHAFRPSVSMTEAQRSASAFFEPWRNQQAVNHHFSQPNVSSSSEHHGNTVNYPHPQPAWNGGSNNNNTYHHLYQDEHSRMMYLRRFADSFGTLSGNTANSQHEVPSGNYGNNPHSQPTCNDMLPSAYQSLDAIFSQYRDNVMHQSAFTNVPPAYGSTDDSANGFGMSSDNIGNSRFGYDNALRPQFNRSNHLPSIQHQNVNSNMQWGSDYYSLLSSPQNQQSPSLRQQEQQPYGELDYEIRRRRDPSNQKQQQQQHPWQRNNY